MGISARVQTYTGDTVAVSTNPAIAALCRRAAALAIPMLGYVDPYDDTWFNKSQMRLVVPELKALLDDAPAAEAEAADELLTLAAHLERKPHRYLIFNGD
ncbi:hypothetical protein ACWERW_32215 [Streptomyces sp. NPDC004012]